MHQKTRVISAFLALSTALSVMAGCANQPAPAPTVPRATTHENAALEATRDPRSEALDRPRGLMWGGFLIGGAGLVTGASAIALSQNSKRAAEEAATNCQTNACVAHVQSERDASATQRSIAYVGLGAAAAGFAVGLLDLFVFSKHKPRPLADDVASKKPQRTTVQIIATPTGGGVGGQF